MSSGYPGGDLSRISHDPFFVVAFCDDRSCSWKQGRSTKATALRVARAHVAQTGHTVCLTITHWQLVHPKEA